MATPVKSNAAARSRVMNSTAVSRGVLGSLDTNICSSTRSTESGDSYSCRRVASADSCSRLRAATLSLACLEAIASGERIRDCRVAGDLGCRSDGGDHALHVPIMTAHPLAQKKAPADTGVEAGAGVRDDVFLYCFSYRQNLEQTLANLNPSVRR
jgi:hypothetical protein